MCSKNNFQYKMLKDPVFEFLMLTWTNSYQICWFLFILRKVLCCVCNQYSIALKGEDFLIIMTIIAVHSFEKQFKIESFNDWGSSYLRATFWAEIFKGWIWVAMHIILSLGQRGLKLGIKQLLIKLSWPSPLSTNVPGLQSLFTFTRHNLSWVLDLSISCRLF